MARAISTKSLLEKIYKNFEFDGIWLLVLGVIAKGGFWLIYGNEKNGKTLFALKLAEYLTKFESVLYVSAEEGTGKEFQANAERAKLDPKVKRLKFIEYIDLETLKTKLRKRQSPKIVIIDNITVYVSELKNGQLYTLKEEFPNITFIFMAHEDKNEPYTSTAKLCKKLAKVIIRVVGLTAFVSGRCPGGQIVVDEQTAMLYHGSQIKNN
jgi:KaiC/GvpD/RAD55 family RecA-like ATPase